MQIKIYFSDLKPEKQRELLPKLQGFFGSKDLPSPLIEVWDEEEILKRRSELLQVLKEEGYPDDASERLEQEAQWKGEEQIKGKPKLSDFREFDF